MAMPKYRMPKYDEKLRRKLASWRRQGWEQG